MTRLTMNVKPVASMLIMVMSLLLITGCGASPMERVAGTYDIDRATVKKDIQAQIDAATDDMQKAQLSFALGMIDDMGFSITLDANGTASASVVMMEQNSTATGTWTLNGDAIAITMKGENEATASTVNGTVSGDRITLNPSDDQPMPVGMTFIKQ